ncbi:MAG: YihY/virulence factor BrkB family protein [Planctomycetota bacterium]|jgi:membrane protein
MSETPEPDETPRPSKIVRAKAAVSWVMGIERRFLLRDPAASVSARFFRFLQVTVLAFRRFREDHASDRAASLAFATILSMLPLLFMALAILGWMSVDAAETETVKRWILEKMVPATAGEVETKLNAVLQDLQKASKGLGIVGFVLMILTGGKLLSTLVRTFHAIWGGDPEASGLRRAAGFWGTILLAPVLVLVSIGLTGFLETLEGADIDFVGDVARNLGLLVPLLVTWAALFTVYFFGPGRRVTAASAALGGAVSALAWETLKTGFAAYVRHAFVAKTVLSGMGVIPLFLLWLVLSWTVFVFGAEIAYVAHDYEKALVRSGILRDRPEETDPADESAAA